MGRFQKYRNAMGIIASQGLLIPWAVVRTFRYRSDHLEVRRHGSLTEFIGNHQDSVNATGAEAMDLFDWDFSL